MGCKVGEGGLWNLASFGVVGGVVVLVTGVPTLVMGVVVGVVYLSLSAALGGSSSNSESDTSEISTCTSNQ